MTASNRPSRRTASRRSLRTGRLDSRFDGLFKDLAQLRVERRDGRPAGARRPHQARRTVKPAAVRGTRLEERSQPPVMVRGGMPGIPTQRRKPARARRRYDVALNVPGAEMRLPSLPQVQIGWWRLLSTLLVLVLGYTLYHLWNSPRYHVEAVEVTGLQRLTSADVNAVLDVAGEPIFTLDAATLQEALQTTFPEFSSVSVTIGMPNKVQVAVEERLPILTWHQDGQAIYVDAQGYAFPNREGASPGPALTVEAASAPPAPFAELVEGKPAAFMPVEMVSAVLSMRGQAPQNATLVYDAQHGLGWRDAQGWQVYFGDVRDMGMKLNVYQAIVARLQQEGLAPSLISVEHVHAPYYRLEQ